ncbi:hypothetical protein [Bradyrhizobium ottawaense]|uniref:1-acyl-sn-glycerol-3-phosphate acyltransferase n=1 Tax=Bradyrhizobium ottawaense TaxID=931866 RepID=A0ABY0QH81_9BRAD|nr:hypothetical protein [Bradyrhizobium ottawaense]SDK42025.1 hypothetical protein SAMN05444163_8068 [Bradyrhizobium ottawaense]
MTGPTFVIPQGFTQVHIEVQTVPITTYTQTVQLAEPATRLSEEETEKVARWLSDRMTKMIERDLFGIPNFKDPLSASMQSGSTVHPARNQPKEK